MTGHEVVTFTNRSEARLQSLVFHLYLNGFRNTNSTWMRRYLDRESSARHALADSSYGYLEIHRIALQRGPELTSSMTFRSPDDGNPDDRTYAEVTLPKSLASGETLVMDVDFVAKLPRIVARTGWKDDYVLAAHWFPKLGALLSDGWRARQFHEATEFFASFGDYDVTLELPRAMKGKVGATGVEREQAELSGGRLRVRFTAEDVHDFAWTVSPRFELHRETFSFPGLPNTDIVLLLQPEHRSSKARYFRAAREALAAFGAAYIPYPYPTLTIVDPPYSSGSEGMEYPSFITAGAPWIPRQRVHHPESVTIHEIGHQVFHAVVASNEVNEAHLDEGFTTYATYRVLQKAYGDPVFNRSFFGIPVTFGSVLLPYPLAPSERYLNWQAASRSDPISQPTFSVLDRGAMRANAYNKPALVLASAERTLGEERWSAVLKAYVTKYAFRHPTTSDFLGVVRETAGTDMAGLIEESFRGTGTFDYAVTSVTSRPAEPRAGYFGEGTALRLENRVADETDAQNVPAAVPNPGAKTAGPAAGTRYESLVVVRRLGEAVWPVEIELRFAGNVVVRRAWDGRGAWIRYRVTGPKLLSAEVDPDSKLLVDINVLNNGRTSETNPAAASHWSHRLRFWAQNVLELFSLIASLSAPLIPRPA